MHQDCKDLVSAPGKSRKLSGRRLYLERLFGEENYPGDWIGKRLFLGRLFQEPEPGLVKFLLQCRTGVLQEKGEGLNEEKNKKKE